MSKPTTKVIICKDGIPALSHTYRSECNGELPVGAKMFLITMETLAPQHKWTCQLIDIPETPRLPLLEAVLDSIYSGGLKPKDFAHVILKIRESLDDSFYEEPPSEWQREILNELQVLAGHVERFFE